MNLFKGISSAKLISRAKLANLHDLSLLRMYVIRCVGETRSILTNSILTENVKMMKNYICEKLWIIIRRIL